MIKRTFIACVLLMAVFMVFVLNQNTRISSYTGIQDRPEHIKVKNHVRVVQSGVPPHLGAVPTERAVEHSEKVLNYAYSDENLAEAMTGLSTLRERVSAGKTVYKKDILHTWHAIDKAKAKGYILPAEALFYKEWLVTLTEDSVLLQRFKTEAATFDEQYNAELTKGNNDPRYAQYKAEEARLTQAILAKYPDDEAQALAELDHALIELRARIYP